MPRVILLGPQRLQPSVPDVFRSLGITGWVATITAGWEERELEDDELHRDLGGRTINLKLWERCDRMFERSPDLHAAMRTRHDRLRALQEIYRLRLGHAIETARELMKSPLDSALVEPDLEDAVETVRHVDETHLRRVREVHEEFAETVRPHERDDVNAERAEISRQIEECGALAIAGGHVAVLLNRLRLFDVLPLVGIRPVVAWSAGAMTLGQRIVLFHDSPPQGAGFPEVLDEGLGAYRNLIAFPHARRRLRLLDLDRIQLLERRFAPFELVPADEGTRLDWTGHDWKRAPGTRRIGHDGNVEVVGA